MEKINIILKNLFKKKLEKRSFFIKKILKIAI